MLNAPKLSILISPRGVERLRLIYGPYQRSDAWRLWQQLLPLIEELDCSFSGKRTESSNSRHTL
jgi:hypothetical protein